MEHVPGAGSLGSRVGPLLCFCGTRCGFPAPWLPPNDHCSLPLQQGAGCGCQRVQRGRKHLVPVTVCTCPTSILREIFCIKSQIQNAMTSRERDGRRKEKAFKLHFEQRAIFIWFWDPQIILPALLKTIL